MPEALNGNQLACSALERLGVQHIFGLPGSQNVGLFEALRVSKIRTVLMSREMGAGFAANGYYRASGKVGVFTTIPGPGFTFALTALAEARHDSAAILYIVSAPAEGKAFALQSIDQCAIAAPVVKRIFQVRHAAELPFTLMEAYCHALEGEPGPVMVEVAKKAWGELVQSPEGGKLLDAVKALKTTKAASDSELEELFNFLIESKRPVIYAGQGCNDASGELTLIAERLGAPVAMTRSARGVVRMDHPLAISFDFNSNGADKFNELLDASDLILVLGCKLGHNGSAAYQLRLDPDKLVHVDSSSEVLGANYPCKMQLQCDVPSLLRCLASRTSESQKRPSWSTPLLNRLRSQGRAEAGDDVPEPVLSGLTPGKMGPFFHILRKLLPADACVVADTGNHQIFTTRYYKSLVPRGLIIPTDFQSMAFCLPAAVGAKLAAPDRRVVAILGDGGIAMNGMELLTAVREKLPLTVIVFNDGALGQIRHQQLAEFGHSHGTVLRTANLRALAESVGATYFLLQGDVETILQNAFQTQGVTLLEIIVSDSMDLHLTRAKGLIRSHIKTMVGASKIARIKNWIRRAPANTPD